MVIFNETNALHVESSVGPFLDFMREIGVQKIEAKGNTCVHHRLFISKYNDNKVSLWSNMKWLPDYMNDGITCNCKGYTITQARDSVGNAKENLKACCALCDPPIIPHAEDVTTYEETIPAQVNAYAHKDINGQWEPNLDAITCYCANGAHFSRSGDGHDVKNNNRFCWLNCKKGWTDGNFKVDWGKAPNDAKSGDIIFRNSRGTRWTKNTVEYLSLATTGG